MKTWKLHKISWMFWYSISLEAFDQNLSFGILFLLLFIDACICTKFKKIKKYKNFITIYILGGVSKCKICTKIKRFRCTTLHNKPLENTLTLRFMFYNHWCRLTAILKINQMTSRGSSIYIHTTSNNVRNVIHVFTLLRHSDPYGIFI